MIFKDLCREIRTERTEDESGCICAKHTVYRNKIRRMCTRIAVSADRKDQDI